MLQSPQTFSSHEQKQVVWEGEVESITCCAWLLPHILVGATATLAAGGIASKNWQRFVWCLLFFDPNS
jgi:hypothetical protein